MGLKAALSKPFAAIVNFRLNKLRYNAVALQQRVFEQLVVKAQNTAFGADHRFNEIRNYERFKKNVPIRDYEDLRPYIDRVTKGEESAGASGF